MKLKLESLNSEIEIKKLPLKKYVDVLKALEKVPGLFDKVSHLDEGNFFTEIPSIIQEAYPEFVSLVSIVTDLSVDDVGELTLDEVIDIVKSLLEVNDFAGMFKDVKKNLGNVKLPKKKQSTGSTTGSTQ